MSTTYSIAVINKRSSAGTYAIFSAPPEVTTTGGGATVYTNVWMSQTIAASGTYEIKYSQDFYAWVGTAPSTPAPGVVISTGSSALATLGTTKSPGSTYPMVVKNGNVSLDLFGEERTASPGAFGIETGTDFTTPNNTYLLGLGKVNSYGYVSPAASVLADNNATYNITPIVKLYVGTSSQKMGSIVNFSQVSRTAGIVDFSSGPGQGKTVATISHNSDGSFTTNYFHDNLVPSFFAAKAASTYSFVGKINWPAATSVAAISAAISLVTSALAARGYTFTHAETSRPDGSTSTRITFRPNASFFGLVKWGKYQEDWEYAVAADTLDDGHEDGGVSPIPEFTAVQFPHQKDTHAGNGETAHTTNSGDTH